MVRARKEGDFLLIPILLNAASVISKSGIERKLPCPSGHFDYVVLKDRLRGWRLRSILERKTFQTRFERCLASPAGAILSSSGPINASDKELASSGTVHFYAVSVGNNNKLPLHRLYEIDFHFTF